jgi:pimeloyl-ACP methyl ester carboxylesterase
MSHTIVLVHGAFTGSSSWNSVIERLPADHRVVAAANPLRSLATDAESVSDLVRSIDGPVLLVGHSYGGSVISNVAADAGEIVGLVYLNAFAPEPGESCFGLAGMFPGSMVDESTVRPVALSNGTTDLYIAPDSYPAVVCADVPGPQAAVMAVTQRPATQEALTEPSGDRPLWKEVPSWFVIGTEDRVIPAALQRFEAERAGARRVLEIPGASHAAAVSQPDAVAGLILEAAPPVRAAV